MEGGEISLENFSVASVWPHLTKHRFAVKHGMDHNGLIEVCICKAFPVVIGFVFCTSFDRFLGFL